jgi:hypothetical protein
MTPETPTAREIQCAAADNVRLWIQDLHRIVSDGRSRQTDGRAIGVVFVHTDDALFVPSDDGELSVSKEKIGIGDANAVNVLRQHRELVRLLLRARQSATIQRQVLKLTWNATNQTLFTASPTSNRFFSVWREVT